MVDVVLAPHPSILPIPSRQVVLEYEGIKCKLGTYENVEMARRKFDIAAHHVYKE